MMRENWDGTANIDRIRFNLPCLTSGTPLYMAPELVREQTYNHTTDLWCELFVGQPPFYTNSVYALFRQLSKDPVKYPDSMSSNFRSSNKELRANTAASRGCDAAWN
ncbi:serine/threonine-protein kinase TIO [Tanacetum coccineum]